MVRKDMNSIFFTVASNLIIDTKINRVWKKKNKSFIILKLGIKYWSVGSIRIIQE